MSTHFPRFGSCRKDGSDSRHCRGGDPGRAKRLRALQTNLWKCCPGRSGDVWKCLFCQVFVVMKGISAILWENICQRERNGRRCGCQVSPSGEEQGEKKTSWKINITKPVELITGAERGSDPALPHPVRVCGEAGGPVRVQPELCAGDRVPGGGRPRHQDRARGLQPHREEMPDIHQTGQSCLLSMDSTGRLSLEGIYMCFLFL